MSLKATVALVTALIVLCFGYWLMVRLEKRGQEQDAAAKKMFTFAPEDVVHMEVQRIDEKLCSAMREKGGAWAFVKPNPTIEPNPVVWDRMAIALAGLMNERTIDPAPKDPKTYGLDKPGLTIAATTADGQEARLIFGALDPTQTYRYVQTPEGAVCLAVAKAFAELDRPLNLLRNPYVFTVGKEGITRLEFARIWTGGNAEKPKENEPAIGEESVKVAVEKTQEGTWRMVSPMSVPANQDVVNELIKNVQFATGSKHIDDPEKLEDYGLKPAKARFTIWSGVGSQPQTLYLGGFESGDEKKPGGLYVKQAARPSVFVMDPTVLTLLPKTPDGLRENRLFSRQATDLASIHYVAEGTDLTFENDPEKGWRIAGADAADTDPLAISNLLVLLKALQGRSFPGDAKPEFGLDSPMIAITFNFQKDAAPTTIRVAARVPNADLFYATMDNGVVTTLGNLDVTALSKRPFYFRKKTLLEFAKPEATRIALQIDGTNYVFEKPRGQWRLKEPEGKTLGSPSDIGLLLKALGNVSAAAVEAETAPADLSPFGLDAPTITVSATTLKDGDPSSETTVGPLKIGKPTAENSQERFAMSPMRPGVYRISQSVVDDIRAALKGIR